VPGAADQDQGRSLAGIAARLRAAGCVFAEEEAELLAEAASSAGALTAMVERRAAGLPLEQVLGWAEFCGLRVAVGPGVFVPRRRSELLVSRAAGFARPGSIVVDLACGSGAIGLAIAARVPGIELHACDLSADAVRYARRNLALAGGHVYAGDLYDPLPARLRGRVAVIAANVPYVPTEAIVFMPPEARDHEPPLALDGGQDGLDVLRRAAAGAPAWLEPGGYLLIEVASGQVDRAAAALAVAGLVPAVASDDDLGATVLIGRR
jgi:release factor glutamine methyltransferase